MSMWDLLMVAKTMARAGRHDFLFYLVEMAEQECAREAKRADPEAGSEQ